MTTEPIEQDAPKLEHADQEVFDLVAKLFRNGKHTHEEIEELAQTRNRECIDPLEEKKVTRIVNRMSKTNRPRKSREQKLYYFPNLAKEDLSDMNYLDLTTMQRGWRAILEKHAWMREGTLPADKEKLATMAHIHDAAEREQFLAEDVQILLYDFELVTPEKSPGYWFNDYMKKRCRYIQKMLRDKAEAGRKSAEAKKRRQQQKPVGVELTEIAMEERKA